MAHAQDASPASWQRYRRDRELRHGRNRLVEAYSVRHAHVVRWQPHGDAG